MAGDFLLRPLPEKEFGYLQAQHLLSRAGFGGTPQQVRALQKMGLPGAVDFLVDFQKVDASKLPAADVDPNLIGAPSPEERELVRQSRLDKDNKELRDQIRAIRLRKEAEDRQQMAKLQRWWIARMITT